MWEDGWVWVGGVGIRWVGEGRWCGVRMGRNGWVWVGGKKESWRG